MRREPKSIEHPGVEELVDRLTILGDALAQSAFQDIADLLQHSHRGRVPLEDPRVQPHDVVIREGIVGQRPQRGRGDAPPPERRTRPLADLR